MKKASDKNQLLRVKEIHNLNQQNASVDAKLVAALERLCTLYRASIQQLSKDHKLTPLQMQLMFFIAEHDPDFCSVSYLAQEFLVTKATISDSVNTLGTKSLLEKQPNPRDSRGFFLRLSKQGHHFYNKLKNQIFGFPAGLMDMAPGDKEVLLKTLLELLGANFDRGLIPLRACLTCDHYENRQGGFYCHLLSKKLPNSELRLDCPEHQTPSEG